MSRFNLVIECNEIISYDFLEAKYLYLVVQSNNKSPEH